jgi:prepilin-type processing-associated H-X9-DG protein
MSSIARSYPGVLNGMSGRAVRTRLRKAHVIAVGGNTCTVVFADGHQAVGGVIPVKGYTPAVGDETLVERASVVNYALGAFTPP